MNCTIVIFGVTGDLTKRKLIPALYKLIAADKLKKFVIIGVSRQDNSIEKIFYKSKKYIENIDENVWKKFINNSYFKKLDFKDFNSYLQKLEQKHNMSGNRLIYLAIPSNYFCDITNNLIDAKLIENDSNKSYWHRLVYEKPFGKDLKSAMGVNKCLKGILDERQIIRIDHYLAKELVTNIAVLRFFNCIFEHLWNNQYIEYINIILHESVGLKGRGIYYDEYGAIRDVVQNHMLQLLSLVAMEMPTEFTGDSIRDERAKVIKNVEFIDGILGQYKGFKSETGVNPNSKTETFASLLFNVNNSRWNGVPFYFETGKCLDKKLTEIQIRFKSKKSKCPNLYNLENKIPNYLTIKIYPTSGFSLDLNAKKLGTINEIMPVEMNFCHSCLFDKVTPEAYEVILESTINNESHISTRIDEIEYAWKVIDMIYNANLPLYEYKIGTPGPSQLSEFRKVHGIELRMGEKS